jgi:hypothetical protein
MVEFNTAELRKGVVDSNSPSLAKKPFQLSVLRIGTFARFSTFKHSVLGGCKFGVLTSIELFCHR